MGIEKRRKRERYLSDGTSLLKETGYRYRGMLDVEIGKEMNAQEEIVERSSIVTP